jgi:hypothetical protein
MLEKPDPEGQPDRRRLYVRKSHSLYPPELGVTMKGDGNEYDRNPPKAPEKEGPTVHASKDPRTAECAEWLADQLQDRDRRVSELRAAAQKAGFATGTLYAARKELQLVEYQVANRKWWRFTRPEEMPPDRD